MKMEEEDDLKRFYSLFFSPGRVAAGASGL